MQSESWYDEAREHRYVLRKQWYEGVKEDKIGQDSISVVITIHPTSTSAFVEDLTSMLIEKNIRQLGFAGFIAINLFSSIKAKNKTTFITGNDENSLEVISTVLKEKRISQIIFACGSILSGNVTAINQAAKIYELLNAKQKKTTQVLVDPDSGKYAHPLNPRSRNKWVLEKLDPKIFLEPSLKMKIDDKTNENVSDKGHDG